MNYRLTTIFLAIALVFVVGIGAAQAAPTSEPAASVPQAAPAGNYDFTNHGTAWIPEFRGQFQNFVARGWGTLARAKAAGSYWIHIPVPYPSAIAGSAMYITYVEFCAKSSNYTKAYPVHWDLYDANSNNFHSENISWPLDNNYNCWGHTFSPGTWAQDLGISLLVTFKDTTSSITLYKAWVRVNPTP